MKILQAVLMAAFVLFETGGNPTPYTATAYALKGKTASGHKTSRGVVAADPRVLPLGTKIYLQAGRYTGEYIVRDTGARIRGKRIDLWVPNVREARLFGRRKVLVTVLK